MSSRSTYLSHLVPWLLVLGIVGAPALALIVLVRMSDTPTELIADSPPVVLPVTKSLRDGRTDVSLVIETTQGPTLVAANAPGVVTSINVATGDRLVSGDSVFEVNDISLRAFATSEPFHRVLTVGMRGSDVYSLESLLAAEGLFDDEPDELFERDTQKSVIEYELAVGVETPTGRFSPELVLWLPSEPLEVARIQTQVGWPAPSPGEPVIEAAPTITSARFVSSDQSEFAFEGQRILEIGGRRVGVIDGTTGTTNELAQLVLARFGEDAQLSQAGLFTFQVVLTYAKPIEALVVASSAVMVSADGSLTCVWATDENGSYRPIEIESVGGTFGVTEITGDVADRLVLMNPIAILEDPLCP